MNFKQMFSKGFVSALMISAVMSIAAVGQSVQPTPKVVMQKPAAPMTVAAGNNLYCAGFIQESPMSTGNRLVGGNGEADQYIYSQPNFMYINMGANKGVSVGDVFSVVRPRGQVHSPWTQKKNVGFYVQEVGAVEVVRVKAEVSVVRVRTSCDSFLLGDLVQAAAKRESPLSESRPALDLFGDPSGKARGRILLARNGAEMLTRDYVAYVDLGADDNVKVGDHLTVFRPLGKGNVMQIPKNEDVTPSDYGYESDVYRGGKFSNQAGRSKGDRAEGGAVTTENAKKGRPELRKVVGEAVVLNVKEKTATVVITRTAQEIHTGDWVEIQ